jgi:hypothetical protein
MNKDCPSDEENIPKPSSPPRRSSTTEEDNLDCTLKPINSITIPELKKLAIKCGYIGTFPKLKKDIYEIVKKFLNEKKGQDFEPKKESETDSESESESESESDSESESESDSESDSDKEDYTLPPYKERGSPTIDELKEIAKKNKCKDIPSKIKKEILYNKVKDCLKSKSREKKRAPESKAAPEEVPKPKKTPEVPKPAPEEVPKPKKTPEVPKPKGKKTDKEIEQDIIIEELRNLGSYKIIIQTYGNPIEDFTALRKELSKRVKNRTGKIIIISTYKDLILEILEIMEDEEEVEQEIEQEVEQEAEQKIESIVEQAELKTKEVEEEAGKQIESIIEEAELKTKEVEEEAEQKISRRQKFHKFYEQYKKEKELLPPSTWSVNDILDELTRDEDKIKCNPMNKEFCPDDFTCDTSTDPAECIPNSRKEQLKEFKNLVEWNFNGKQIIGSEKTINKLKRQLEEPIKIKKVDKKCDPLNDEFCPDDMICDMRDPTNGKCITEEKRDSLKYDWEEFTHNGKRIVGTSETLNMLKRQLKPIYSEGK